MGVHTNRLKETCEETHSFVDVSLRVRGRGFNVDETEKVFLSHVARLLPVFMNKGIHLINKQCDIFNVILVTFEVIDCENTSHIQREVGTDRTFVDRLSDLVDRMHQVDEGLHPLFNFVIGYVGVLLDVRLESVGMVTPGNLGVRTRENVVHVDKDRHVSMPIRRCKRLNLGQFITPDVLNHQHDGVIIIGPSNFSHPKSVTHLQSPEVVATIGICGIVNRTQLNLCNVE